MKIERVHTNRSIILQLLLYALPTVALVFLVLYNLNKYFNLLQNDYLIQGIYFALGISVSIIFYARNFRISSTFILLTIIYLLGYLVLEHIPIKDFDIFNSSIQFISFTFLFSVGWLAGYGFSRWNSFTIVWVMLILSSQIYIISRTNDISAQNILTGFLPSLFYSFYIIYITELIKNTDDTQKNYSALILKKLTGFLCLFILFFVPIYSIFNNDFKKIEEEWNKTSQFNKKKDTENMMQEEKDGSIKNKNSTQLAANLNKGKRLVFVAHLNHYFEEEAMPNPLYFTSRYYTKFDSTTQQFETDDEMPMNDLFKPNPASIPLYFNAVDSSVIRNSLSNKGRAIVDAEVYKVLLSPDEFIAPSTAFYCQPISVPQEYKNEFKSAYRAKMWVSKLNSAYFVYNGGRDSILANFQKSRFTALRNDTNYSHIDTSFLHYYTQMPNGEDYEQIKTLAHQIIVKANARTNIDKIIAIRDYFLSEDEFGHPLYAYSDNPGIPGIPNANKIKYFLLENRKGYCAYFAGGTLFLLRALGIPSRLAAGFLTIDRSSKNQGWYWFYEDQAHAWVQAFFPEYGWIDFDTTIPDMNAIQSSQPDGTPPIGVPTATFVADGQILAIDTLAQEITLSVSKLIVADKNYESSTTTNIIANISGTTISADTGMVSIQQLTPGTFITAVSYQKDFLGTHKTVHSFQSAINELSSPVVFDELKVILKNTEEQKKTTSIQADKTFDWSRMLLSLLGIVLLSLILMAVLPLLFWIWFKLWAYRSLHHQYRAILFYLNQLGFYREKVSPTTFALSIDQKFETGFALFTQYYQKWKYSNGILSMEEKTFTKQFLKTFLQQVHSKTSWWYRTLSFLNTYAIVHFLLKRK